MSVYSDNVDFPCGQHVVTPRPMSGYELRRDYLPLRFSILYGEQSWTKERPAKPVDLIDAYDQTAWPFGIYLDNQLVAAIRLIFADSTVQLPSGPFISNPQEYNICSAEISKAMVNQGARGCGLFTALLLRCRLEAIANGVDHLFISVIDSEHVRTFLNREGFSVMGSPFKFADHTIAPDAQAIVLHDALSDRVDSLTEDLSARLQTLYTNACKRLSPHFAAWQP